MQKRNSTPWLVAAALATMAVAAAGTSAGAQQKPATTPPAVPAVNPAVAARRAIDPANLDTTCAACADFFEYANGGWLKTATIPAAYTRWGSFNVLMDRNQEVVHEVLEEARRAAPRAPAGSSERKLGTFYATCMDTTAIEAAGAKPLQAELQRIAAISSKKGDLQAEVERLKGMGLPVLFTLGAMQDPKQSTQVILTARQGGLGMPDREYYTKTDSASAALRERYVAHVARTLALAGESEAEATADAKKVMAIETALANASRTRVQLRDPKLNYNKMTVAELQTLAPAFDWARYLADAGVPANTAVNVGQPDFFKAMSAVVDSTPLPDLKAYLRWHVARAAAPALSTPWVNEDFAWTSTLSGQKELQPRWKRCIQATDQAMGEALGEAYVKRTFTPQAKARALAMVENLQAVLRERIGALAWMSDSTRAQAQAKLAAFTKKIGYPDKWRDYSALVVEPGPYATNVVHAQQFAVRRNLAKVGKPVDRTEWGMTPPTVNAYYNPSMNEIVFPAGILQPPFFDPNADDAVNYGGMGAVIGHEMTHGFDDQGRQFDAQGNLRDWWTPADAAAYKVRADRVASQYDAYTVADGVHVNGRLTLGENIADLGGVTIAYYALQKSMEGKPRPANIDGFTPEQRFFLSYAQIWRSLQRPEAAKLQVATDPHSPARFRVNGPLSNMPEFQKAWGCKAGDAMVRPEEVRAQIW